MTVRRNSKQHQANSAEGLAARLPDELRSVDAWMYPDGLRDFGKAVKAFMGDSEIPVYDVMQAAGVTAADWFRARLTMPDPNFGRN